MRVVQVTAGEVVGMVVVWNGRVATPISMCVGCVMCTAAVGWRAGPWIGACRSNCAFVDVIAVHVVQVPIVHVVYVPVVADGGVAAAAAVLVRVPSVCSVIHVNRPFWASWPSSVA